MSLKEERTIYTVPDDERILIESMKDQSYSEGTQRYN
jgi:hypothetical protein